MGFAVERNKTAIKRARCSRPIELALSDGIITKETTVFDFGCGHGSDVRYLHSKGIKVSGWDPYYRERDPISSADAVNLGYVLNVIEDPTERHQTLHKAFSLAKQVLIVAVRVEHALEEADGFSDGVLTKRGTFQKIFSQGEFREYIESLLCRRIHVAALGVLYVFNNEEAEARYVAARAFTRRLEYRVDLIQEFKRSKVANSYVTLANRLGRVPLPEEFPEYHTLIEGFGSPKRIERLALCLIDPKAFKGSREQRREDILTYLAILRFQCIKPPGFSKLPVSIQSDIKTIWKTYGEALKDGETFLFSIGNSDTVANACLASPVGKLLPRHLYVHRSAEDEVPPLLRVLLFAAKEIVGELPYELVKFAKDGRAISFLNYHDFDMDPHPALVTSVKVYLPKSAYDIREYSSSPNPPILHRKETFVAHSYPHYAKFRSLTEQEDSLGLLSSPDIGYRRPWEGLLEFRRLKIESHVLHSQDV